MIEVEMKYEIKMMMRHNTWRMTTVNGRMTTVNASEMKLVVQLAFSLRLDPCKLSIFFMSTSILSFMNSLISLHASSFLSML